MAPFNPHYLLGHRARMSRRPQPRRRVLRPPPRPARGHATSGSAAPARQAARRRRRLMATASAPTGQLCMRHCRRRDAGASTDMPTTPTRLVWVRDRGARLTVDRLQTQQPHQPPHPVPTDHLSLERVAQVQLVDAAHQRQGLRAVGRRSVVQRRAAHFQQSALVGSRSGSGNRG